MNKHAHTLAHSVRKNYLTLSGLLFAFFWTWSVVSSSGWQARHSGMDGRRCRPSRKGGAGSFTLPRELVECHGKLYQRPVRELESLRQHQQHVEPLIVKDAYLITPCAECEQVKIRMFIDRSSVEVFVNDGEACMTSRIYPQLEQRALTLYPSQGEAVMLGGSLWHLK
nr:GH32 C-terminal domain-containing protein [Pectobacterium versatile]